MEKYVIAGGKPLVGNVTVSGAKNAALAILPATVLAPGNYVIENIPNIRDITISLKILRELGAEVRMLERSTVAIDSTHIREGLVPHDLARMMRASYYFIGALLGRFGRASVAMPGGCDLGARPIDQHIKGFEALGANVSIDHGVVNASGSPLFGSHIYFDGISVGATINLMLASVRAKGLTILENVAKEPHVVDLANFLNSMGADIRGAGTDVIKIHGVDLLHGTTYSIIPDQIEAGTYMIAAAATRGDVTIQNIIPKHLESITQKLIRAGAEVEEFDDSIHVTRQGPVNKVNIKTLPHPGFPTDMQPQMTALLTLAEGTSIITEGIFDNRFRYADELCRMGANIQVDGTVAVVEGVPGLKAAPVRATDLRAGAALLIAALVAEGTSEIEDTYHLERGYEDVCGKMRRLGADIKRVVTSDHSLAEAL